MNTFFNVVFLVVLGLLGLGFYWYKNPLQVPHFLRNSIPGLEMPSLQSPVSGFRPPQFGPR